MFVSTRSFIVQLHRIWWQPLLVFEHLRRQPTFVPMLCLIVGGQLAVWLWYYLHVDATWLCHYVYGIPQNVALSAAVVDERQQVAREVMMVVAAICSLMGSLVVIAATAFYLELAGARLRVQLSFPVWAAFATWVWAPMLPVTALMAARWSLSSSFALGPDELNPLSLNMLVGPLEWDNAWRPMADLAGLQNLRVMGLMYAGLRHYSGAPPFSVLAAVLAPHIAVLAAWAALVVLVERLAV